MNDSISGSASSSRFPRTSIREPGSGGGLGSRVASLSRSLRPACRLTIWSTSTRVRSDPSSTSTRPSSSTGASASPGCSIPSRNTASPTRIDAGSSRCAESARRRRRFCVARSRRTRSSRSVATSTSAPADRIASRSCLLSCFSAARIARRSWLNSCSIACPVRPIIASRSTSNSSRRRRRFSRISSASWRANSSARRVSTAAVRCSCRSPSKFSTVASSGEIWRAAFASTGSGIPKRRAIAIALLRPGSPINSL